MSKPLDKYSRGEIDFLDAEWMRRNKFNPLSVAVAHAIKRVDKAKEELDRAYQEVDNATESLTKACDAVAERRMKCPEA